jgi:hypothetical protein
VIDVPYRHSQRIQKVSTNHIYDRKNLVV